MIHLPQNPISKMKHKSHLWGPMFTKMNRADQSNDQLQRRGKPRSDEIFTLILTPEQTDFLKHTRVNIAIKPTKYWTQSSCSERREILRNLKTFYKGYTAPS